MSLKHFFGGLTLMLGPLTPLHATPIGEILVCYACQDTGNSTIDSALASNPGVASDGILFAFVNTSAFAITGGTFSVTNASPDDSFAIPTIAAGATFILMPGITSDGGSHPSSGLFACCAGAQDTSDGAGGLTDSSVFSFTGMSDGLSVVSLTFGTSTGTPDTFAPGDPGLDLPYRSPVTSGSSESFIGQGPSGDGGCSNCYFGEVATLNTVNAVTTPEPGSLSLLAVGLLSMVWAGTHRRKG